MIANTRNSCLGDDLVALHVGNKPKEFLIRKRLFSKLSDFFYKAFDSGFKEADGVMFLPEDDLDVFGLFLYWIYQSKHESSNFSPT